MLKIPVVTKEVTVTEDMNNFFFFLSLSAIFSFNNTCILGELCKEGKREWKSIPGIGQSKCKSSSSRSLLCNTQV